MILPKDFVRWLPYVRPWAALACHVAGNADRSIALGDSEPPRRLFHHEELEGEEEFPGAKAFLLFVSLMVKPLLLPHPLTLRLVRGSRARKRAWDTRRPNVGKVIPSSCPSCDPV
jgi:hypothetical protein